ncbi:MAG: sugar ABC transporter ATP-binding protein [Lachnospiraceae bacterium]|nr:sugar ABC transporter ATP-binding protein [Lachnospiraceae bacterium]
MEKKNIVEMRNIQKSFFGSKALDGFNLSIGPGEVRSLMGENGCGKSTAIKIMSGFYDYDGGEIYFNGELQKNFKPKDSMKAGIQVIYQDFSLYPNLTVAENIMMNKTMNTPGHGMKWKQIKEEAAEVLKQLGAEIPLDALVEDLNVAQRQMVAICRSLVQDAKLIIMDEPTSALTYKEIQYLYKIVKGLTKRGISTLFVSHKLDEVEELSSYVTIMRNGKNVFEGSAAELNREKVVYYMTGREINYAPYEYDSKGKEPIMKVEGLTLEPYFEDINFSLYSGEILGITGLLGCGRSELAKSLFGLMPSQSGTITIDNQQVKIRSVDDALKNRIGYVPEDRMTEGLHMPRKIGTNAIACVTDQMVNKYGLLSQKDLKNRMTTALQRIKVAGLDENKAVQALSGGNQQKVLLIKWLEKDPKILILNCPTVGVDVGSRSDIHEVIKKIAAEGLSVIVISDDISEIKQVCNRLMVMQNGKMVFEADTKNASTEKVEAILVANGGN